MPLYEYRCTACGYSFEKIQKFSDTPETDCPKCHGLLVRPVTAPALKFEGAGWYVNDYAGKGGAKSGDAAKGADGASASEAKPEGKADSGAGTAATESKTSAPATATPAPSSPSSGS